MLRENRILKKKRKSKLSNKNKIKTLTKEHNLKYQINCHTTKRKGEISNCQSVQVEIIISHFKCLTVI